MVIDFRIEHDLIKRIIQAKIWKIQRVKNYGEVVIDYLEGIR